jgi:hypothetical protein
MGFRTNLFAITELGLVALFVVGCTFPSPNVVTAPTPFSGSGSGGGTSGGGTPANLGAAYNKLPDTSQGSPVSVFSISDQPSMSLPSDPEARFAASHFAGVQKMLAAAKMMFVAYNPNWVQLHYRLGAASGPVAFIHLDSWSTWPGTEWSTLFSAHPEYFLRDTNGNPDSYDGGDQWYAHDLTNADMKTWWINQTVADMQASDSDMTFGDSFNGAIGCAMTTTSNGGQCDPRLEGTGAIIASNWTGGSTYAQQLNDWMVEIQNAFHQQSGTPLFIPNLASLNTEWYFNQYNFAAADGAFLEGFPEDNEDTFDNVSADNYALQLTGADKVVIIQSYIDPTNLDDRLFSVCTYLLIKGKKTFLNMVGGGQSGDTGFYYWPEYTVQLGNPLSAPPQNINSLLVGNVYQRAFQNGIVMVNGSASPVTASLPSGQTLYQVTPVGGGSVNDSNIDASGNLISGFMSLTSQPVSGSISIDAWSGAILMNSAP